MKFCKKCSVTDIFMLKYICFAHFFIKNSFWGKTFNLTKKALEAFFVENFMTINFYIN